MPLTNFGAILNFAEKVEQDDMEFYRQASKNPAAGHHQEMLATFAMESKKHISLIQRTRRENVTEMILEPIRDFVRNSYQLTSDDAVAMDSAAILAAAVALEKRAICYYSDAAEKMRALAEVSRALKTLAKKRTQRLGQVESLSA
ncbi:MAG: ferritin-like domain-containing protein [Desulfosarcina sp.]|nr:ferritin-like domain-containing protein [Desulfosarcina sp.]